MQIVAGVDTHKKAHAIAFIDEVGKLLDAFEIEANAAGFALAIERASKFDSITWGLEGTGSYGQPFANELLRRGHIVYEVPGTLTKRHRRQMSGSGKTDPRDAKAIAEAVLRERDHLTRYLAKDEEEATRLLYARRDRLVRESTIKANRIRALAVQLQLELPKDLTTKRALLNVGEAMRAFETSGLADFEALDEMKDIFADFETLLAKIPLIEARLRPFVDRLAPQLLLLDGCATVSAAGIIGNAGPIENYRSEAAFAAHTGAPPVECSSGKYSSRRLNTGGNRQLNRCLHTIANVQMRTKDSEGYVYYNRKRAEGKTHRAAMRCLKRRLARVVYNLLKAAKSAREIGIQEKAA